MHNSSYWKLHLKLKGFCFQPLLGRPLRITFALDKVRGGAPVVVPRLWNSEIASGENDLFPHKSWLYLAVEQVWNCSSRMLSSGRFFIYYLFFWFSSKFYYLKNLYIGIVFFVGLGSFHSCCVWKTLEGANKVFV